MSDNTSIEWTDATWNPITGCSVVSPGCTNCYAMKLAGGRLQHHPSREGLTNPSKAGPVWNGQVRFNQDQLALPLRWTRPRRIFVCAHGDLFHEAVPDHWIDQVFAVMALSPQHTFQVLTKRPERMRAYFADLEAAHARRADAARVLNSQRSPGRCAPDAITMPYPLPNVWLGVSAEDQARADERIPLLAMTPAAVRFLSAEPLLGEIDLVTPIYRGEAGITIRGYLTDRTEPDDFHFHARKLDWVIVGGESGPGARPMHPDWARQIRDDCAAAGVAFHFKQWGDWHPHLEQLADGSINCIGNPDQRDRWHSWENDVSSWRIGKKDSGRLLDGVTHDGFPGEAR